MKQLSNQELLSILVGSQRAKALSAKPLSEVFGFEKQKQLQICEEPAVYAVHPAVAAAKELVLRSVREQMETEKVNLTSPEHVRLYLCSEIGHLEYESFWCLWLDAQHRLIACGELFRGTLTQTSVYPREVAKLALQHNASAVIFAHNHPSGIPEPSQADIRLTDSLKGTLALLEVKVLDHIVVAGTKSTSFAERGLI